MNYTLHHEKKPDSDGGQAFSMLTALDKGAHGNLARMQLRLQVALIEEARFEQARRSGDG
jgi:hypothetical protein